MSKPICFAALTAMVLAAGAAHAETRRLTVLNESVAYSDSDLSSDPGAQGLLHRIDAAAGRLCASRPASPLDPRSQAFQQRCRSQAVANAVDALAAPRVTAAYAHILGRAKQFATR